MIRIMECFYKERLRELELLSLAKKKLRGDLLVKLEQVAQRGDECPIPRNSQGQAGWSSEQPVLVEDVPGRCRGDWN